MLRFIKRLFGRDAAKSDSRNSGARELIVQGSTRQSGRRATDVYFDNMAKIQGAISRQAFEEAATLVRESFHYIPDFVRETKEEYGAFDISSIPALQQGGTMLALARDDEGLAEMRDVVASSPELEPWREGVERHLSDRVMFEIYPDRGFRKSELPSNRCQNPCRRDRRSPDRLAHFLS